MQGVCFRAEAQAKAKDLHLVGWARNNSDGTLEMHIEGTAPALQKFEQWCQRGPNGARVEEVLAKDEPEDYQKSFTIQM